MTWIIDIVGYVSDNIGKMYLRATTRKNKDGQPVRYLQLVENVRDPRKGYPVAKVLYNFGRGDEAALRRLAKSITRS